MKNILLKAIILMLLSSNVFAQNQKTISRDSILTLKINDFGKFGFYNKSINDAIGIQSKYITSAFYISTTEGQQPIPIPVNDQIFNYTYFHKYIYPHLSEGITVKLTVKKYWIDGKEILVATKIE